MSEQEYAPTEAEQFLIQTAGSLAAEHGYDDGEAEADARAKLEEIKAKARADERAEVEAQRLHKLAEASKQDVPPIVEEANRHTPGRTKLDRLCLELMRAWGAADKVSSVSQHPAGYIATFADMARAVLAWPELRDERAKRPTREQIARALHDKHIEKYPDEPGSSIATAGPGQPVWRHLADAVLALDPGSRSDERAGRQPVAADELDRWADRATRAETARDVLRLQLEGERAKRPTREQLEALLNEVFPIVEPHTPRNPPMRGDDDAVDARDDERLAVDRFIDALLDQETCECGDAQCDGSDPEALSMTVPLAQSTLPPHPADVGLIALLRETADRYGHRANQPGDLDTANTLTLAADRIEGSTSSNRAPVIVLCGSSRFKDQINAENRRLTMAGNVVLSLGFFGHAELPELDWDTDATELKRLADRLHFQKIDMANIVHVVNPGGYIGESTRREIAYAESQGKPVTSLEPITEASA